MAKTESQFLEDYAQIVEKIVFDEDELETLKITVKNFTEGKISAKELKQLLLQCRGRMVDDISEYMLFMGRKIVSEVKNELSRPSPPPPSQIEVQLREEIREKNDLLETVAIRVNNLVSKFDDRELIPEPKPVTLSIEEVNEEVERNLNQIGANEWIDMCFYEDTVFFVKLYPKLEALYEERFYERDEANNETEDGKKIMANKMEELGFPEEIETDVIKYVVIRNKFQHSMTDLSTSNLELAQEVFAKVLVYLIASNFELAFLSNHRETVYSCLEDIFIQRLTGSRAFRRRMLARLKTVF